jgi:hypothetical protein
MFNFQVDGVPSVSSHFWIYWAVTLPLTIFVFLGLQYWMHSLVVKDKKSLPDEERSQHSASVQHSEQVSEKKKVK